MRTAIAILFFAISAGAYAVDSGPEKTGDRPSERTATGAEAYDKAVKQCTQQAGAEKQKCIEAAKEKFGEMLK